ncbi:MAG: hypothetical protein SGBAC_006906 [Bacillariaceae sp.]
MSLQQVIDMNNTAVGRMKDSHPEDAFEMLILAVRCFKSIQPQSSVPVTPICDQESVITACLIQEQEGWKDDTKIESNRRFVYSIACSIPNTLNIEYMAPVMLFNLALSRHCQANQIYNNDRVRRLILSKATKLYEIAFHSYLSVGGTRSGLMAIAITNNIALIYEEVGESKLAQQCFESLRCVLVKLLEIGDTAEMPYAYDFLHNLIPMQGPQIYGAGAA